MNIFAILIGLSIFVGKANAELPPVGWADISVIIMEGAGNGSFQLGVSGQTNLPQVGSGSTSIPYRVKVSDGPFLFVATPNPGYVLTDSSVNKSYTVVSQGSIQIVLAFDTMKGGSSKLTLGVSPTGAGSIVASGGVISTCSLPSCTPINVLNGTTATLTANPTLGKVFQNWGTPSDTVNPKSITINSDISVTANFINASTTQPKLTLGVSPAGSGSIVTSGGLTTTCALSSCVPISVPSPTNITFTANPASGKKFQNWGSLSDTATPKVAAITADTSVTANFVDLPPHTAVIHITGNGFVYATSIGGTITSPSTCGSNCAMNSSWNTTQLKLEFIGNVTSKAGNFTSCSAVTGNWICYAPPDTTAASIISVVFGGPTPPPVVPFISSDLPTTDHSMHIKITAPVGTPAGTYDVMYWKGVAGTAATGTIAGISVASSTPFSTATSNVKWVEGLAPISKYVFQVRKNGTLLAGTEVPNYTQPSPGATIKSDRATEAHRIWVILKQLPGAANGKYEVVYAEGSLPVTLSNKIFAKIDNTGVNPSAGWVTGLKPNTTYNFKWFFNGLTLEGGNGTNSATQAQAQACPTITLSSSSGCAQKNGATPFYYVSVVGPAGTSVTWDKLNSGGAWSHCVDFEDSTQVIESPFYGPFPFRCIIGAEANATYQIQKEVHYTVTAPNCPSSTATYKVDTGASCCYNTDPPVISYRDDADCSPVDDKIPVCPGGEAAVMGCCPCGGSGLDVETCAYGQSANQAPTSFCRAPGANGAWRLRAKWCLDQTMWDSHKLAVRSTINTAMGRLGQALPGTGGGTVNATIATDATNYGTATIVPRTYTPCAAAVDENNESTRYLLANNADPASERLSKVTVWFEDYGPGVTGAGTKCMNTSNRDWCWKYGFMAPVPPTPSNFPNCTGLETSPGWPIAVHEMGHLFGFPDYYALTAPHPLATGIWLQAYNMCHDGPAHHGNHGTALGTGNFMDYHKNCASWGSNGHPSIPRSARGIPSWRLCGGNPCGNATQCPGWQIGIISTPPYANAGSFPYRR